MNFVKDTVVRVHNAHIKNGINLELNGLRGAACLLIFLFHCRVLSGNLAMQEYLGPFYVFPVYGAYAVDLFFVLSGFFIILPFVAVDGRQSPHIQLGEYYRKKSMRIFPPYYLMLIFMFGVVASAVYGWAFLLSKPGLENLIIHLSFLQYLMPATSSSLGLNGALWTLSITFQFFLVFPLLKPFFVQGRQYFSLFIFAGVSVLWKYAAWHNMTALYTLAMDSVRQYGVDEFTIRFFLSNQLPAQLGHFAIGMFLGDVYVRHQRGVFKAKWYWRLLVWAGVLSAIYSFKLAELSIPPWFYIWRLWLAVGSGCLIYILAIDGPKIVKFLFNGKYVGFIGYLSYEIYLWHVLVIYVISKIQSFDGIQGVGRFGLFVFLCGSISLVISYGSVRMISMVRARVGMVMRRTVMS